MHEPKIYGHTESGVLLCVVARSQSNKQITAKEPAKSKKKKKE